MYTLKQIQLHTKCLCILELINKANERLNDASERLSKFQSGTWDMPIVFMNKESDLKHDIIYRSQVLQRLTIYYNRTKNLI